MIRFLARTLGLWLLAGSFAAAVVDGMKSIAGSTLRMTAALETWTDLAPTSVATARAFVSARLGPTVWAPLETALGLVPTWALLGGVGIVLIALARPRHESIGVTP